MNSNFKIDFIGIGAPRAASSWIFQCLTEHPQICGAKVKSGGKETNFFYYRDRYGRGLDFYASFFSHCQKNQIKGEFSVHYLAGNPQIPSLIKKHFPAVKLIACLRNPIERVYSHIYYCQATHGTATKIKDFERTVLREKELLQKGESPEEPLWLTHGLYYTCLQRYLKLFPRGNMLILIYEDIARDPVKFIQGIYKFLGVDSSFVSPSCKKNINFMAKDTLIFPWFTVPGVKKIINFLRQCYFFGKDKGRPVRIPKFLKISRLLYFLTKVNIRHYSKRKVPVSRPPMDPKIRKVLQEIYEPEIKGLEKLLNRDLSFWK